MMRIPNPFLSGQYSSPPWPPPSPGDSTLVAEGSREPRKALTDAADMVAGPAAVHAEGAGLGATMAIEPRGADWGGKGRCSQQPQWPQPAWPPLPSHIMMKGSSSKVGGDLHPPHPLEDLSLSAERSCSLVLASTEEPGWTLNLGREKPGKREKGLEGGI